jgi:hypothetical protein
VLKGPGISDDCRTAVMVGIIRGMQKAEVKIPGQSPSSPTLARKGSAISGVKGLCYG